METSEIRRLAFELDEQLSVLKRLMYVRAVEKGHGMTGTQMFMLQYLDKNGPARASDISKVCGLSPGAVTQICDELEGLGFVERSRSEADRRVVFIHLRDMGRAKLRDVRLDRGERLLSVIEQIPANELEQFMKVLAQIIDIGVRDL